MRHAQISLCGLDENKETHQKLFASYIGQEISNYRKAKGYTQKQFAKLLNQSIQQVQNYEYGKGNISLYKLIEITEVLDTSIIDFLINVCTKYNGETIVENFPQAEIFTKIQNLTKEQQKALFLLL